MRAIKRRKKLILFFTFITLLLSITLVAISYRAYISLTRDTRRHIDGKDFTSATFEMRKEILQKYDVKEVRFNSADGVSLAGIFIHRSRAKANLLVCHGYRSFKERNLDLIEMFPQFNIFFFDFRAHGQSSGEMTTIGLKEFEDVIAAVKCVKEKTKDLPLCILGISMGGAAALKACGANATKMCDTGLCDALILDSVFTDLETEVGHAFAQKSGLPTFPFLNVIANLAFYCDNCDVTKFRPIDYIKNINVPLMIIHSCVDELVPTHNALELYETCCAEKKNAKLWVAPPAKHAHLHRVHPEFYKNKVIKFLERFI